MKLEKIALPKSIMAKLKGEPYVCIHNEDWADFVIKVRSNNRLIDEAVPVYGHGKDWSENNSFRATDGKLMDTHTAWLIGIEPIREETASDVLRWLLTIDNKMILESDNWSGAVSVAGYIKDRAKEALKREESK